METVRLHAIISGRVQGVNFRYYTVQEAQRLNTVGWVCNSSDGTVEVMAEGPREQLEMLLTFLPEKRRKAPAFRQGDIRRKTCQTIS